MRLRHLALWVLIFGVAALAVVGAWHNAKAEAAINDRILQEACR